MTKVIGAIVTFAASQLGYEFPKLKQLREAESVFVGNLDLYEEECRNWFRFVPD